MLGIHVEGLSLDGITAGGVGSGSLEAGTVMTVEVSRGGNSGGLVGIWKNTID